jgi:hypothetical protein
MKCMLIAFAAALLAAPDMLPAGLGHGHSAAAGAAHEAVDPDALEAALGLGVA